VNIIDIGMYDGADTCYYLESGNKVLAVRSEPALCAMADQRLSNYRAIRSVNYPQRGRQQYSRNH